MSVKALLKTYLRQQKQISMPDLVVTDVHFFDVLIDNGSKKKQPAVSIVSRPSVAVKNNPPVKPEINKPVTREPGTGLQKLSSLRKVDTLAITPRVRKPAVNASAQVTINEAPGQKRELMKKLYMEGCGACHLSESRTKMVFGSGNAESQVMIIGEAPGEEEDAQGLPFVGAAGQLLTQMLSAIQLDRSKDTFVTNVLKCRLPSNRNPESAEIQMCLPLLKKQIAIMRPKAILLLGRIAAHALLGTADSIAKMRSQVFTYEGIPCMVIYHPAALLHNAEYKRPAWEDLQKFKELLITSGVHGSL